MAYWVIGGEYRDSALTEIAPGKIERFGPFADYEEARKVWAARTWATVDNALARYRIVESESPPDADAAEGAPSPSPAIPR